MTEKEKMLAGLPYDAWDEVLLSERMTAKAICHSFNAYDPAKLDERMALLSNLLTIDGRAHIEPNFYCDYGYNIRLGNNFYSNHHLTILDVCRVYIGDNVLIGPHVMISTATHPINAFERRTTECGKPISIGSDVWIGGNASILPGVSIGNNSVIGAGSVVNKDIPDNCVAVGNPCKVAKSL
ncbi:sugar O-acetyltransferase [Microbulbifer agarilyticus]|uniref:sugar O-acetyltransferase n=1 Tax=Microbulbifer agarilyticus TaxID=260552 RepID=UPI001C9481FB|nr:sugar O-acetyltransferase [Microbulbifer agarilyticus]MBY6211893.1 sugar O-acetyltransferase [Microbulbifer agarilyticus]